ncbi:hypothetical protein K505DRAFT_79207 [Melanomma pulvis-pyrius CBS 109.77]|uniref:Uncharacterized protein n=1 Tax=Melanomma pulvis-pyrius CBS 109.77 TaxID=1314802 RepID=A0A6A6X2X9_9PLEO|nr:hypothetical protein K505DRAFT_79207 [Melanomma pulvis-pyrius CBS 109.77]
MPGFGAVSEMHKRPHLTPTTRSRGPWAASQRPAKREEWGSVGLSFRYRCLEGLYFRVCPVRGCSSLEAHPQCSKICRRDLGAWALVLSHRVVPPMARTGLNKRESSAAPPNMTGRRATALQVVFRIAVARRDGRQTEARYSSNCAMVLKKCDSVGRICDVGFATSSAHGPGSSHSDQSPDSTEPVVDLATHNTVLSSTCGYESLGPSDWSMTGLRDVHFKCRRI